MVASLSGRLAIKHNFHGQSFVRVVFRVAKNRRLWFNIEYIQYWIDINKGVHVMKYIKYQS